jgi:hypothetical protein
VTVVETESADPLYLGTASVALVRDTSFFGATAPLFGARSRFEIGFSRGSLQYGTLLFDWRRYYMPVRPFTIAVRGMHYGRYGRDSEHVRLLGLYTGYPEFVHGYGVGSFSAVECPARRVRTTVRCRRPYWQPHYREYRLCNAPHRRRPGDGPGADRCGRVCRPAWRGQQHQAPVAGGTPALRSFGGAVRINVNGLRSRGVSRSSDRVDCSVQWQVGDSAGDSEPSIGDRRFQWPYPRARSVSSGSSTGLWRR